MDLGSGSYVFQLLMAGLLGLLFALKMYLRSFKSFVKSLFSRDRNVERPERR